MKSTTLMIVLALLLFSCSKKDDNSDLSENNVLNLEVGQKLRYILLKAENYSDPRFTNFEYTRDTLELEVLEVDNNKYLISEKITPLSNYDVYS